MTRSPALVGAFVGLIVLQPNPPLKAGELFHVLADHQIRYYQADGTTLCGTPAGCTPDTTSYALRIDGAVKQTLPNSANTSGTITFDVPGGLPAGTHSVIVEAVGSTTVGAVPVSLPIDPAATPAPGAQGAPSIQRGSVTPPPPPPSGLSVSVATPWAIATSGTSVTTSPITLAAGDLVLVVAVSDSGTTAPALAITAGSLTWTSVLGSSAANDGGFRIWRGSASAAATGFSATVTTSNSAQPHAAQLVIAKGADLTQPIGASWTATSTTNAWSATTYTATKVGSIGVGIAVDWHALGPPTSTDLATPGHLDAKISWLSVLKLAPSSTLTPVSVVFDAAGSAAPQWRAGAVEIRPR